MANHLDLQQLRMFFALAQTGSFTEAAKRLYRTQSAVSHAIRKLESSIDVKLVEMKGRKLHLTEEGKLLYEACEKAFSAFDRASEAIMKRQGRTLGKLLLGATTEFGCTVLMKHMRDFLETHPSIDVDFYMSNELIGPLLAEELDIIIDCKEHHLPELDRTTLFRESYTVMCSPEYKNKHEIQTVDDLARCTILSLDHEGTWWNRVAYSMSMKSMDRLELGKIVTINHIRGIIVAAVAGVGVGVVPSYSILSDLAEGHLVPLFPDLELLEDRFSIYQKKSKNSLERHRILTDYLRAIQPSEFVL